MTYNELKEQIEKFSAEQLEQDVTIYVSGVGEYYSLVDDYPLVESDDNCDVLDEAHKFLVI